jgi:hypothetical protein
MENWPLRVCFAFSALASLSLLALPAISQTNVLTFHNDNAHTGQNLAETSLTPANVNSGSFGKLLDLPVDGKVDGQPLYVSGLQIPSAGSHNVVFATTEHGSVYAFDANDGTKLWQVSLLKPGESLSDSRNCNQVVPEIGITATPVIDLSAGPGGTIYVVAMSKDAAGNYHQRLHALNLQTGAEEFGGPVEITATYPGTGENSSNGMVVFDPKQYKERASLLLLNGVVYTSWTSHCDIQPYTGWLIGYNETTLAQTSVLNFAPNGEGASIWGSGGGPANDADGNIFIQLANGTFDTRLNAQGFPNQADYGNAFVKVTANGGLQLADYWTMYNTVDESNRDQDLGSGGVLLLPDLQDSNGTIRHLGVGAGKDAHIYVFDRDNMGKFNPSSNASLYQDIPNSLAGGLFATPAWFNGTVYFGAVNDTIRAYSVNGARLATTPSSMTAARFGYPGVTPSISANGSTNAILWAVESATTAVLHAYDATDLSKELYNSNQAANGRDHFGAGNKYMVPTIADGKVFVGTPNSVAVFGLLQSVAPPPPSIATTTTTLTSSASVITSGAPVTLTASVSSANAVPSGELTFMDGNTALAVAELDAGGTAILSTTALPEGVHSITANYAGTNGFAASASAPLSVTVGGSAPGVTFTVNPVTVPPGVTIGTASMSWNAPDASIVEIHIGAPDGVLFAQVGSQGSATTGDWVTNGMTFFLQDVSGGKPLTPANTLAIASAQLQAKSLEGTLTIDPSPIYVPYGSLGTATLHWNTPSSANTELHVNAPDGPLFAAGGSEGTATATGWVTNGMTFYLQDVSAGAMLTGAYTIAKATAQVALAPETGALLATPNPITAPVGQLFGSATLNWNTSTASTIEIHVNAPDGPLFVRGGPQGTATASGWARDGLVFFLQDVSQNQPLTTQFTIATQTLRTAGAQAGVSFQASPNPITVATGVGLGSTTLYWNAPSASTVEIHVGAPGGPLLAQGGSQGNASASGWVSDGLTFYLQDVSDGKALAEANTLATVTAHLLIGPQQ